MSKSLTKDTIRNITKSWGRFISILMIVALGVAFFVGVKSSPLAMEETADHYFDEYNLMDVRLISPFGFNADDVLAIEAAEGIEGVFPTYTKDVVTNLNAKELVLRIHGLPIDQIAEDNQNYINRVKVTEGRLPQKSGEAVVEKSGYSESFEIGSTITLESGTDTALGETLKTTQYTIVGFVETPYYLSFEKGTTSIGSGMVESFMMIPQDDFIMDVYTDVYVTVENSKPLMTFDSAYADVVDPMVDKLETIGISRAKIRYDEIIDEATTELNDAKAEYESEKAKAEIELDDAAKQIEDAKLELANGEKELANQRAEFDVTIADATIQIQDGEAQLINGENELNKGYNSFLESKPGIEAQLNEADQQIKAGEIELSKLQPVIAQLKQALEDVTLTEEERGALVAKLSPLEATYNQTKATLDAAKQELEAGRTALVDGENKLLAAKRTIQYQKQELDVQKEKLETEKANALNEFAKARTELDKGKVELEEAQVEYLEAKADALQQFADAEKEIKDAEKEISRIVEPEWYVLDRNSHASYVNYENAASSIEAISQVFPVFFFMVAALVCLTTMTRMVDEQRMTIGTLKGLGYNKLQIASKFLVYAGVASITGSILGTFVGFNVFPTVVLDAYSMMYILPESIIVFDIPLVAMATLIAIGVTTLSAYYAVNQELIESPSVLMRPKAPKEGKRILLERIPFIWNRLSFTGKVTVRNIFRYKKRFFMTVFGIAGCTALLLTGFGIKDSIRTIVDNQFGSIFNYDMTVTLDRDMSNTEKDTLATYLSNEPRLSDVMFVKNENGKLHANDVSKDISIFIPENLEDFENFISLHDRLSKEKVVLPDDGVVLTEKVAKQLNVKVSDELKLENVDGKTASVKVAGIAENYLFHYVYIAPQYYETIFASEVVFENMLTIMADKDPELEGVLTKDLIDVEGISGLNWNSTLRNSFDDTVESLNYVVLLMIVSAGALAFVVLYNLTNVNISERMREIATIKVLGFYDKEVSAYIYRENMILTIIGTGVGLGLGILLHRFIMLTVEMDMMMFGRNLDPLSFVYSGLLTIFFSVLVNFAMYYKLKNIEMVESLKSVD